MRRVAGDQGKIMAMLADAATTANTVSRWIQQSAREYSINSAGFARPWRAFVRLTDASSTHSRAISHRRARLTVNSAVDTTPSSLIFDLTRDRITSRIACLFPEQVYFLVRFSCSRHTCLSSLRSAETREYPRPASLATYIFRRSEHPGYENREAFSRRAPRRPSVVGESKPRGRRVISTTIRAIERPVSPVSPRYRESRWSQPCFWHGTPTATHALAHTHAHKLILTSFCDRAVTLQSETRLRRLVRFLRHLHAHLSLICLTLPASHVTLVADAASR